MSMTPPFLQQLCALFMLLFNTFPEPFFLRHTSDSPCLSQ
jgi:hypothetical protein